MSSRECNSIASNKMHDCENSIASNKMYGHENSIISSNVYNCDKSSVHSKRRSHKAAALVLACVLILQTAFMSVGAVSVKVSKVTVKSPTGSTKTVYVGKGKTVSLKTTVTVTPNKAANKKVTYTSSNKKIATVSAKGVVKGVKVGTTKITVKSKKNAKKKKTITVKVKKKVTKVNMSEATATVLTGATKTLKATVSPASAYNKVKWSSSNKTIATVTSAGVVTGLKPGTVAIKATAYDGSKKSATCNVTVKDPVSIKGIEVLDAHAVRVTLTEAAVLTATDFKVMMKQYSTGNYLTQCKVSSVASADNTVYDLTLVGDSGIPIGYYVQVSIAALNGTTTMETIYTGISKTSGVAYIGGEVGKQISDKTISFAEYTTGTVTYTVGTLPAGITYTTKGSAITFAGTPTAAANGAKVDVVATDELGHAGKIEVYFYIGSASVVVAYCEPITVLAGADISQSCVTGAFGGSGSYKYAFSGNAYGMTLDAQTGKMTGKFTVPGTYTLYAVISDESNAGLSTTVSIPITVEQAVSVTGNVKNASGSALPNAMVAFSPVDSDVVLPATSFATDASGNYTAAVTPGVYMVTAQMPKALNNGKVDTITSDSYRLVVPTNGVANENFSVPVYQVNVKANIEGNYQFGIWYYKNEQIGTGSSLYMGTGTYTDNAISCIAKELDKDGKPTNARYTAVINVNVKAGITAAVSATATMTKIVEDTETTEATTTQTSATTQAATTTETATTQAAAK